MHYIPLLIAPHPSPWLLKTSCFQGFLLLSADPGDSSEGSTTETCTSCYEFRLQELSSFLPRGLGGEHSAEQCLQPCSDRTEPRSHPEELPKIRWTPQHTAEQQCARIHNHMQRAMSILRKWAQTKAHLQTIHANDPSLYPRLNPRLSRKAASTSNSGICLKWDLNQRLWPRFMFNIWSYFAHCNTVWRPMLLFFLIAWRYTVGWKTMFLYSQDLWFPKYIFSFLFFFLNIRTTEL